VSVSVCVRVCVRVCLCLCGFLFLKNKKMGQKCSLAPRSGNGKGKQDTISCHADSDAPSLRHSPCKDAVYLNIYDVREEYRATNSIARSMSAGGAFHTGIEVHGMEWSYGVDGVYKTPPRTSSVHLYRESICLGSCNQNRMEVVWQLETFSRQWGAQEYDFLRNNCINFCKEACLLLGAQPVPSWVDRFPRIGAEIRRVQQTFSSCVLSDKPFASLDSPCPSASQLLAEEEVR